MNVKQTKLLEWFDRLERFARNKNLPLRLMDSIGDLKEQAAEENPDWYGLYENIEDLLHSIGLKVEKSFSEDITANGEQVSTDEFRQKIMEIMEQGHQENLSSINMAVHGNHTAAKECYRKMKEITSDKNALKKIGDGNYFLQFFENVKHNYEQNVTRGFNDFVESVSNNCTRMIERISSMSKSIDGYKLGLGAQEFYVKYSERKESWDSQLLHRVESAGLGSNVIMDFAQESLGKIQGIIQDYQKKRNRCIFLPLLILLLCGLLSGGFFLVNKHMDSQNAQTEQANAENIETNDVDKIIDYGVDVVGGLMDSSSAVEGAVTKMVLIILVAVLAVYIAYVIFLVITFQQKSLSACGEFLQKECALFEKENRLDIHSELEDMLAEYEKHYFDTNIFSGMTLGSIGADGYEYKQLLQEWNTIQRMREGA